MVMQLTNRHLTTVSEVHGRLHILPIVHSRTHTHCMNYTCAAASNVAVSHSVTPTSTPKTRQHLQFPQLGGLGLRRYIQMHTATTGTTADADCSADGSHQHAHLQTASMIVCYCFFLMPPPLPPRYLQFDAPPINLSSADGRTAMQRMLHLRTCA